MKKDANTDHELTKDLVSQLDAGVGGLDEEITQRLAKARAVAVSSYAAEKSRRSYLFRPATVSFAAAVVLVCSLFALAPTKTPRNFTPEDLEVITSNEQVELIQDLDFYRWLAVKDQRPEDHR